ncbi:guanine nucleotide exchange factor subunit Rich [Diorhabda carinulata]|uniref:guanine nucleotide exchange factor subunit Rich n=1 Tax=Diorhabda carinulata TaxID=1163345 RepID=UPI0025A2968D|nr:guanine nucleotide exchange factor subunit Rich [Diorhabda carinulata]
MYFPVGWPKVIKTPELGDSTIKHITSNRDRILFAIITDDCLGIWFCRPCVPIVFHRRSRISIEKFGTNVLTEWKPDSSMIVIATSEGHLLFYNIEVPPDRKGLYNQTDSPLANLRRESAELFIKETIPPLKLTLIKEITVWDGRITGVVCITMTEIMLSTTNNHVLRYKWDGNQNRDYALDLRRIPFCINQQVAKAVPIVEENVHIIDIEYSPLVGGFSIVLNDNRAAFLTAPSLKFDPNQVQGIWAQGIDDATCTVINHKFRLITFGRLNSECIVYTIDETTGGLELSHSCVLSSKDYPGDPGAVEEVLWTPDGCALVASWSKGGIALWSTFGALLMCSLGWDYGLNIDLEKFNPLRISCMEFATEGYQLWMIRENTASETDLIQLDFVKSALAINPCMSHQSHLYLQGEDKLYINSANTFIRVFSGKTKKEDFFGENISTTLAEGRQWLVVPVPSIYYSTNWPVRYSAIDSDGLGIAIAGRTGLAHYSILSRRWKLFGNETQEKDFIVAGGLLWWRDYMVMGCYSILDNGEELRFYPRESKLDNKFAKIVSVPAPILLINILSDQLITLGSNAQVCIWQLQLNDNVGDVVVTKSQVVDISALAIHPACIASVTLTSLRTETVRGHHNVSESILLNVSGRLLLVQREFRHGEKYGCLLPTVLASCVENVWVPRRRRLEKAHLTEAMWLFCGSHGMRVWLPLYPRDGDKTHTFMSKRIMLPFHLRVYPLAILFEDAIILGVENDTVLYTSDSNSPFSLPLCVLQRTSQVYLHQILRQLIRRNLGYHAWEIARSCMSLPYFPHSLELLLHEVLEEEATSKEPIPDAQLPSVLEFIMEYPVYLQTVVQCARKTEIALWPYLFSVAGKPKDLFQECLLKGQLDTAASYLIILQNLETSSVSRQYATLLLNTALDKSKWKLAKDLVRFLRAIDPNDVEYDSPRTSFILPTKLGMPPSTPSVSPNAEDLSLILGNVQGPRVRSYSTTISPKLVERSNSSSGHVNPPLESDRKKSVPNSTGNTKNDKCAKSSASEEFFIDVILQKHARRLLSQCRLTDLGYFAAYLDFHLVNWLGKERERAARVDDFVKTLKFLHEDFRWPYPTANLPINKKSVSSPIAEVEEQLKCLKMDAAFCSRIGDSGYTSFQGIPYAGVVSPVNTLDRLSRMEETDIEERIIADADKIEDVEQKKICDGFKSTTLNSAVEESVMSTASSVWGEERDFVLPGIDNWEVPSAKLLEQLSNNDKKGSQRSEVQLRYLLQLFIEANCLEWSLVFSILLRDAMAVLRIVNAAKSHDQSVETVSRLRQGLLIINYWTNTECLGYSTFMSAIFNQTSILTKILETKVQQQIKQQQTTPKPTRSRKSSSNFDGNNLQTSIKDKGHPVQNDDSIERRAIDDVTENIETADKDNAAPNNTGCIVS